MRRLREQRRRVRDEPTGFEVPPGGLDPLERSPGLGPLAETASPTMAAASPAMFASSPAGLVPTGGLPTEAPATIFGLPPLAFGALALAAVFVLPRLMRGRR